jgi:hypothetical protein
MPVVVCWFAMNLGGHKRRSVGTAWQVGFGNSTIYPTISYESNIDSSLVGGIIATYSFLSKDAPEYRNGYIICISFACLSAAACIAYVVSLWYENRQRDRNATVTATNTITGEDETEDLGDLAPSYRYAY